MVLKVHVGVKVVTADSCFYFFIFFKDISNIFPELSYKSLKPCFSYKVASD